MIDVGLNGSCLTKIMPPTLPPAHQDLTPAIEFKSRNMRTVSETFTNY